MIDSVISHMDDGKAVLLTLLNISAAFDTEDHRILLRRFRETVKIDGAALRWFESYLDKRSVSVGVDGQYSEEVTVDCAVLQGSILGPQEYSSYTIPLGSLIRMLALLFHFFADDSRLWKTVNPRSVTDQLHSIRNIETSIKSVAESN